MYDERSECNGGWLHEYIFYRTDRGATEEVCTRCHDKQVFTDKTPNREYYSYHRREGLQKRDKRFAREYARS